MHGNGLTRKNLAKVAMKILYKNPYTIPKSTFLQHYHNRVDKNPGKNAVSKKVSIVSNLFQTCFV